MSKFEIQVSVGNRIRELRKSNKISQEKLASLAELDRTYINSVENGRRNISIKNIHKICVAFGCSINIFFTGPCFYEGNEEDE